MEQTRARTLLTSPPPPPAATARPSHFAWVDAAKGFGIILVVLGHALRGLVTSDIMAATPTFHFVDDWIYAFHMPLFFFLSGLFLFRSTAKPWLEFASDKLRTIAYPYFVWSAITLLVKAALGSATNHPYDLSDFPQIFYQPIDQFWFLYALFLLLMVASAALKLGFPAWAIFVAAVLLYPGLLPVSSFGLGILNMTRLMALYFGLGVFIGSEQNIRAISGAPVRWLPLGVAAGLLVSSLAGWSELPYRRAFLPTSMFAVSGIAAVVALALLADKAKLGAAIQLLGRHSLEIYVVHTIAMAGVRITLVKFAHISAPAPHLVLGMLAGLYIPMAVAVLFERVGFQFGFTLPKSVKPNLASQSNSKTGGRAKA
jgi:fucose 4-O-acetylase-like acetyltransferase